MPEERDDLQMYFLRRWLAERCRREGRRKGDLPLPESVQKLSSSQIDRYCRWKGST